MIQGVEILDYLSSQATIGKDPGESSHWQKYHSNFNFTGDGFSGLIGFGGNEPVYKGVKKLLNTNFQKPYRNMGYRFSSFQELDALATKLTQQQSRAYDLDVLRQVITLSMLSDRLGKGHNNSLIIGDGFASMTSLILLSGFSKNCTLVNLTKTLIVDLWYLKLILGEEAYNKRVFLATSIQDINEINLNDDLSGNENRIIAFEARNQEFISKISFDVAINIASMQEMSPSISRKYLDDMRKSIFINNKSAFFYCCNRIEKKLPGGEVAKLVEYGWDKQDEILIDELCPWHQKYYSFIPLFIETMMVFIGTSLLNLKYNEIKF